MKVILMGKQTVLCLGLACIGCGGPVATRSPLAVNDPEPNLVVSDLKPMYLMSDQITISVANKGRKDQNLYLELMEKTAQGHFLIAMEDAFLKADGSRSHFSVKAGQSLDVKWVPNARPKEFVPRAGGVYRLSLLTDSALAGGGAVYESTPFILNP